MSVNYDLLAKQYRNHRKPDPRIAARIRFYTEGARRILNVGSGIGSYEPEDCDIVAVEPSNEMNARRKNSKATLLQGVAEYLPFKDNIFDMSLAILTMHHWSDIGSGLKEMARVSKYRLLLFTWIGYGNEFWLENYIPEIRGVDDKLFPSLEELERILGELSVEIIEIPHNCCDGFMCAYWRRPEAYLDPKVRKAISTFSRVPDITDSLDKLQTDVISGAWHKKHSHLLEKETLDLGYRLVVCESLSG